MNDTDIPGSCSIADLQFDTICTPDSINYTGKECRHQELIARLFKINCHITHIFYVLTAICVVIGTILNSLSLYCFLRMNKRNSQFVYLFVLSLGDTMNLYINFGLPILRQYELFDNEFRNLNILCRITGVLTEFFLIFPTWIIVLLTMERLISISCPLKRRSLCTQERARIHIMILAIIVLCLSLYRLVDLKGIDQVSVFSLVTCNGNDTSIDFIRNINLMIWTILPECLTFVMSLFIIYQIKSIAKMTTDQSKYTQATRTVLLMSILFLVFHTPTGMYFLEFNKR